MCNEQCGKIPVGMAGLKNPIGDLLGRVGKRCTAFEGAQTYEENLHVEAGESTS